MAVIYRKVLAYEPRNDSVYMSTDMKRYFQNRLFEELESLIEEERMLSLSANDNTNKEPDFVDQSAADEQRFNFHVYQEHEQHLKHEVEAALQRLSDGTYGYCVATGKPVGVERLMASPYASYCFDVQENMECNQKSRYAYGR